MFQTYDHAPPPAQAERQEWMALLARAPQPLLDAALSAHVQVQPQWLRRPETGLMMVQGRAGGTGDRFNLGEVTVTRCALRVAASRDDAPVGVAYVLGRNHHQAQMAALADALLQDPAQRPALETALLAPVRQHLALKQAQRQQRAQTTKVDFLTVAREAGDLDNGADEEAA
jgi:alpha-D-ribose 1-methylphosphonate 5-triphosphate synthase subunit PhnG